jgi:hypothetical protein
MISFMELAVAFIWQCYDVRGSPVIQLTRLAKIFYCYVSFPEPTSRKIPLSSAGPVSEICR